MKLKTIACRYIYVRDVKKLPNMKYILLLPYTNEKKMFFFTFCKHY